MKRRIGLFVLVLALLACLMAVGVSARDKIASGKCGDNLTWTLYEDGELVIEGTGDMWDYSPWEEYSTQLKKLTLAEGITTIGEYAFFGCSGFTGELVIPDSVTTIGEYAFSGCSGFTGNLVIPDSVTSIGSKAFRYCSGFTGDLTIGGSVTSIGENAFEYCHGFTGNLVIPDSVTTIGYQAFRGLFGVVSISVADSNKNYSSIDGILYNKDQTTLICAPARKTGELVIPDSVTSIGNGAFEGCGGFTGDLVIPGSVTSIGENAFNLCSGFTGNLVIGDSVSEIGRYAFYYCRGFTGELVIPDSVTSIGNGAFEGCSGFTGNLVIGDSVSEIGNDAFDGCSGLTSATVYAKEAIFSTRVFQYTTSDFTIYGYKGSTAETYATANNHNFVALRGIIDSGKCGDNLTWTLYDDGELVIEGTGAMWDYENYESQGTISPWRKYRDSLKKLTLRDGITTIGDSAFIACNGFTGNLVIPDSVTEIGEYAFDYCSGFTGDLVIPNSITTIGKFAFRGCSGFTGKLVISNSVIYIAESAFSGCSGFTGDLIIPDRVTSIGSNAFWSCTGFTGDLIIGNSVRIINQKAFRFCSGFTGNLVIPGSVTSIGPYAFEDCSGLTGKLIIPGSVTTISKNAFSGCSGFTGDLVIPGSVTAIGEYAFNNCSNFKKVYFEGNAPSINATDSSYPFRSFDTDVTLYYLPETTGWVDSEYYNADAKTWKGYKIRAWVDGYTISGTVTSFNSATDVVTIELFADGATEAAYSTTVTGNSAEYTFETVEPGTYTMTISKSKHATREYTVVVETADLEKDVEIWMYGDVYPGDKRLSMVDATQIQRYLSGKSSIFGSTDDAELEAYRLKVADVYTGDGRISMVDVTQIQRYLSGKSSIYDSIQ